jgi:hypothetical protein
MADESHEAQSVEIPSASRTMPDEPPQPVTPAIVVEKKTRLRRRDCIDWIEFGVSGLEAVLTVVITILIVYELFYSKHQDELASRAPAITFSQNSVSIQVVPLDIIEHPRELIEPEEGLIYNGGKAALLNGSVVAFTDQQDVKISCADGKTPCKQHMEPGYVFSGVDFDFGTLAVHRGVPIKFSVTYMSNHKPFKVRLSVSGDNIGDSKVADLTIDPTMRPPPSKH